MIKISKSGIERLRLSVINLAQRIDLYSKTKLRNKIKRKIIG